MRNLLNLKRCGVAALMIGLVAGALPLTVDARVRVGVSDWPGWVAWYVTEKQGLFKKHGADVELVWFPRRAFPSSWCWSTTTRRATTP